MNKKNQIIISAASVSAAMSAIMASSVDKKFLDGPSVTAFDAAALEALATAKSQSVIQSAFPRIASTIRLDLELGRAAYAEIAFADGEGGEGGDENNYSNGNDGGSSEDPSEEEVEEEPEIEYNPYGIPLDLLETFDDSEDGEGTDHGDSDSGDFESVEAMIEALGLQVPEGVSAEDYITSLETLYAEVIQQVETIPEQLPIEILNEAGSSLIDSTTAGDSFFSCYSNCHSACHGSRGWR
jgi:hypothetical protein